MKLGENCMDSEDVLK